jgi:hypothetical protein
MTSRCRGRDQWATADQQRWQVLGVSENSDGVPEHKRKNSRHVQVQQ